MAILDGYLIHMLCGFLSSEDGFTKPCHGNSPDHYVAERAES